MQALLDLGDWTKATALFRGYPDDVGPDITYSGPVALFHLGELENAKSGLERAVAPTEK